MTARERAIEALQSPYWTSADTVVALNDIEALESAGLAIVDRELLDALVGAVRCLERMEAMRDRLRHAQHRDEPHDAILDGFELAGEQVAVAHARAIALLNERGE